MTEQQNTSAEATDAAEADQQPTDATQEPEQQEQEAQQNSPNAEAKKYRLRLRETEANLQHAQTTITELQDTLLNDRLQGTIEIHPQTGNRAVNEDGTTKAVPVRLREPGDLFNVGEMDRNSLFTESGALDTEALSQAATELYTRRPDLFDSPNVAVPSISNSPETATSMNSWQKLLQGK